VGLGRLKIVSDVQKRGFNPNFSGLFLACCLGRFDIVLIVQKSGSNPKNSGIYLCVYEYRWI
jgi:hypothetical protein